MNALLKKEMRLSALVLTYLFIGFGVMTMLPGYPILCGVFFLTLGIYRSFQNVREANDIVYSALLPVSKRDVVKGKYQFVILIEFGGFVLMALLTALRMTLLKDAAVYRENALMNANPFFLGAALFVFGLFNAIFLGGFFRTAYQLGKPFVIYIAVAFLSIGAAEALHHVPGMEALNAFGFEHIVLQIFLLLGGVILYILLTGVSYRKACVDFEMIDL
ncbi:MAG: ABC-2 transporter permease [Lachnospiraceae bacterium]|jgi:hypothetical protein|nr:ABC-2 transporter permease [Lachnospiraceae bacterium]MCI1657155.1 ABC-2 transporter permease [Lachnospiraceae bacterium]MCI2195628.1 ABC-2 transporter permease [Lachnospiraceae bacterium]